jgi:4-alpha-glucanotransferase
MEHTRGSGILLSISSLPSCCGIGDLGPWAIRFADFLRDAGQKYWQFLPIHPVDAAQNCSPYSSPSAFAGNPLFVSPEELFRAGLLRRADMEHMGASPKNGVDCGGAFRRKQRLFEATARSPLRGRMAEDFGRFCLQEAHWLDDYALFAVLKRRFEGRSWHLWPPEFRDRAPEAMRELRRSVEREIGDEKFFQFIFFRQWETLKTYCGKAGIRLIGDLPLYLAHDSADVWSHRSFFRLDCLGRPTALSGVPPDFFSKTGQLWGMPLYRWRNLQRDGFGWWVRRFQHMLKLFDIVRLDHVRGYVSSWAVPAGEKTAVRGRWVKAPAAELFATLAAHCDSLPVIAEDLGFITEDVRKILRRFAMTGTRPLLFAFGADDLPRHFCAPHNLQENTAVYTSTHDLNTVRGWFEESPRETRQRFCRYVGRRISSSEVSWEMIRIAMSTVAALAIFPMQDLLGLGASARMNRPGTTTGNWRWRLSPSAIGDRLAARLHEMTELYGRR